MVPETKRRADGELPVRLTGSVPDTRSLRGGAAPVMEAATEEQKKSGLSWNSHTYVDEVPDSLVRDDDLAGANMEMRRRFEANCRRAQVRRLRAPASAGSGVCC